MHNDILIAASRDIVRAGLRNIFIEDMRVSKIYEAADNDNIQRCLLSQHVDLVVIHQLLFKDVTSLPDNRFVILADKPDIDVFKNAYINKARGYFSENVTANFLRTVLDAPTNMFLVDPTLTSWVIDALLVSGGNASYAKSSSLSPREKEIYALLQAGLDRRAIANQLCIAETTLKTHIKNINRKRKDLLLERENMYIVEAKRA